MRSYAPYDKTKAPGKRVTAKTRQVRTTTEWDLRIDCDVHTVARIISTIESCKEHLDYVLVSGVEQPDIVHYGSKETHVHVALIAKQPIRRDQALAMCRGPFKATDEYAVPRNRKFTYAGWYLHHAKLDWKIVTEPPVRLEIGQLPDDEENDENKKAIKRMINKFANDDLKHASAMRERFNKYLN